jgi:hypothetical protein
MTAIAFMDVRLFWVEAENRGLCGLMNHVAEYIWVVGPVFDLFRSRS